MGLLLAAPLWAGKRPPVTNPKATDGDAVAEPDWEKRLSISVGPKKADLVGTNEKVLQAAVDYMARMGGGTVQACKQALKDFAKKLAQAEEEAMGRTMRARAERRGRPNRVGTPGSPGSRRPTRYSPPKPTPSWRALAPGSPRRV